jgi:hypothetical protein
MTEIFRFVSMREPDTSGATDPIDITVLKSNIQNPLSDAKKSTNSSLNAAVANIDPLQVARAVQEAARGLYHSSGLPVSDPKTLALSKQFAKFDSLVSAATSKTTLTILNGMVTDAFKDTAERISTSGEVNSELEKLSDSIVLIVLLPELHAYPLDKMSRYVRLIDLVKRIAQGDTSLESTGAVAAALAKTILLPPAIFPLRSDIPEPRIGDLLIVRQNLKRYEGADISSIENVLTGETRTHTVSDQITLQQTNTTVSSTTTTTVTEQDTTDRFALTNAASNVVNDDTKAQAGLTVTASYGPVQMNASASLANDQSTNNSTQSSVSHAQDVTSRAVKSIITSQSQQQIYSQTEVTSDVDLHSFSNPAGSGAANISGVYQYLNKIYEAQIFNYGQRMLIDLIVPEPAAFLLDAITEQGVTLIPPVPLLIVISNGNESPIQRGDLNPDGTVKAGLNTRPMTPADVSTDFAAKQHYYGTLASIYAAQVDAPPEPHTTISKGMSGVGDQSSNGSVQDMSAITIPDGYQVADVAVTAMFSEMPSGDAIDGDEQLSVFVGTYQYMFKLWNNGNQPDNGGTPKSATWSFNQPVFFYDIGGLLPGSPQALPLPSAAASSNPALKNISVTVLGTQVGNWVANIQLSCTATDNAMEAWRVKTFSAIMQAYQQQLSTYNNQVASNAFRGLNTGLLGGSPDINLTMAQLEIKKACVALLSGTNIDYVDQQFKAPPSPFNGINSQKLGFLPIQDSVPTAQQQGDYIRFFEQVFEWENMTFLYYPYFWSRKTTDQPDSNTKLWQQKALMTNDDPNFLSFLQAGAARVVVPIRTQLEPLAMYFLMTGQIWGGGDYSGIADQYYLPLAQELEDQEGGDDNDGIPYGPAWELTLPTQIVRLRADSNLPQWQQFAFSSTDTWIPSPYLPAPDTRLWVPGETNTSTRTWTPDYGSINSGTGDFDET